MKHGMIRLKRRAGGTPRQGGFTLVELLLVLVILALIGGLILPRLIGQAEGARAKAERGYTFRRILDTYYPGTRLESAQDF